MSAPPTRATGIASAKIQVVIASPEYTPVTPLPADSGIGHFYSYFPELADRLYMNKLSSVYHGEHGLRTLKELVRSYLTISKDLSRVMTRVKAIYRSWAIPCTGKQVYAPRHRAEWLGEDQRSRSASAGGVLLPTTGCAAGVAPGSAARSAGGEQETQGLETALPDSFDWSDPGGGVAGILQTPHRFRTKRQLWTYGGFGIETHSSADHRAVERATRTEEEAVSRFAG